MSSGNPWSIATARISGPKRGPGTQQPISDIAVQSLSFSLSWGSQPAQGAITYVSSDSYPPITYGAWCEITCYGKTFYGICQRAPILVPQEDGSIVGAPTELSSSGKTLRLDFVDPRTYLRWDQVFCAFNILDIRMVNGRRVRRYKHLLPQNYRKWLWTYTVLPMSAAAIIQTVLQFNTANYPAYGTVGTIWTVGAIQPNGTYVAGGYHADQVQNPVMNIDALSGKGLDEFLQEISDAQGLLFTLQGGPFNLVWCRKGDGPAPIIPTRSDDQQISQAISENPTRLFVVGDRNRYLCLDLVMSPDWNRKWESFLTVDGLMQWLFDNATDPISGARYNAIPDDTEQATGYQLAAARAREITVREIVAIRGADWSDFRLFSGRSRMDMPAALYLEVIVFRAFRPPGVVNIKGEQILTQVLQLTDDLLAKVYLPNLNSPAMEVDLGNPPVGNGFAVARGFNVGAQIFNAIKPERFNLADFENVAALWQQVTFQIDDSMETGRYIIMDEKMINPAGLFVDQAVEAILNPDDPTSGDFLNGYTVLRADAVITPPEVRAALVFEGDKFVYTYSTGNTDPRNGSRDDKINEGGLYQEIVQFKSGAWVQLPYADGMTAEEKATQIASVLCRRPYWYYQGSYRWKLVPGDVIPDLSGMLNRISLAYSASGHTCDIEFANGRPEPVYRQEREYDRRRRLLSLLPGQQELRDQSRILKEIAAAFRQSPKLVLKMEEFLRGRMGQISPGQIEPCVIIDGTGRLKVGTPLWKASVSKVTVSRGGNPSTANATTRAVMPSAVGEDHRVFVGVTTRHNEDASKKVWVQNTGLMLVRVDGGTQQSDGVFVEVGDKLVRKAGADYLVKQDDGEDGAPVVGEARERITASEVRLIQVMTPAGGGGGDAARDFVWL